ncbi:hypothetical protein B0H11DRAFT_2343362 [Mycena galericulata]|nr:hypothetical protein B0H11DRAFT_2343362 [Mycena galericulata]
MRHALSSNSTEHLLENTLRALLADPDFLPAGGFLAFGLEHKYPMPPPLDEWSTASTSAERWDAVLQSLRGSDARIRSISMRVGLIPSIKVVYNVDDGQDVAMDELPDLFGVHEARHLAATRRARGEEPQKAAHSPDDSASPNSQEPLQSGNEVAAKVAAVHWLTDIKDRNRISTPYIGEDSMIWHASGVAALFVSVPVVGNGLRMQAEL